MVANRTILLVAGRPWDQCFLNIELQLARIEQAFHRYGGVLWTVVRSDNCTTPQLQAALATYKPSILHISGHGSDEGLVLEDNNRRSSLCDVDELAWILEHASTQSLHHVVCNCCHSASWGQEIAEFVDVIAMEGFVGDSDAAAFSTTLYKALAEDWRFRDACFLARMTGK